jgi:hypothetical protein
MVAFDQFKTFFRVFPGFPDFFPGKNGTSGFSGKNKISIFSSKTSYLNIINQVWLI